MKSNPHVFASIALAAAIAFPATGIAGPSSTDTAAELSTAPSMTVQSAMVVLSAPATTPTVDSDMVEVPRGFGSIGDGQEITIANLHEDSDVAALDATGGKIKVPSIVLKVIPAANLVRKLTPVAKIVGHEAGRAMNRRDGLPDIGMEPGLQKKVDVAKRAINVVKTAAKKRR